MVIMQYIEYVPTVETRRAMGYCWVTCAYGHFLSFYLICSTLRLFCRSMPSSFKGIHGKIVYTLEAKLVRKWKLNCSAEEVLNFESKICLSQSHLMTRQVGATDKEVGVFSKGSVHMDASIDTAIYSPGDTVKIAMKVNNSSSKDMRPKFSIKQTVLYRAQASSKHGESEVCKLEGDVIEKKSEKNIICTLKIPPDLVLSIQNCEIITVEYQLKVYLDISFAFDPEIKFPLVIVPVGFRSNPDPGMQAYPPAAYGGPSNSDFPPPAVHFMPPPPGPGAYSHPPAFPAGYGAVPGPPVPSGYPVVYAAPPGAPAAPSGYPADYAAPAGPPAAPYPVGYPDVYPAYPPMPGAQPAMFLPAQPVAAGAPYCIPAAAAPPQNVSPYGAYSSSPVHHPPPPAVPPLAPAPFGPGPSAPPSFGDYTAAPTFNLPSFGPDMNTNFLDQQNGEPPSYVSIFPPPATDKPSN